MQQDGQVGRFGDQGMTILDLRCDGDDLASGGLAENGMQGRSLGYVLKLQRRLAAWISRRVRVFARTRTNEPGIGVRV